MSNFNLTMQNLGSKMDGWYKIPPNSGPKIHQAHNVLKDQPFNLLVLIKGYSVDTNKNMNVTYDFQIFDPKGKATSDAGFDISGRNGPSYSPDALILSEQYPKIVFTERYEFGTYAIKVTVKDKNSRKKATIETKINLIPFSMDEKFTNKKEIGNWIMSYYDSPSPTKSINAVQDLIQLNNDWLNENLNTISFFFRIFTDNPFLFKYIAKYFDSFSIEDKKKFLLFSALCSDSTLESKALDDRANTLIDFYQEARKFRIPDVSGEIHSGWQLDILWSEFFATGKYDPIKKIVTSLKLKKYTENLEKLKTRAIKNPTEEDNRKAYLGATYQSAVWSLISNCKQMPLVFKYCVFMYQNEEMDLDIKNQLGPILRVVQNEISSDKQKSATN